MSQATLMREIGPTIRTARSVWFKRDHPRAIDQYINFFGGVAGDLTVADPGREAMFDAFGLPECRRHEVGP